MGYKEMYQSWLDNPYFDEDTKAELKSIAGDDKEIEDRFYTVNSLLISKISALCSSNIRSDDRQS